MAKPQFLKSEHWKMLIEAILD